MWYIGDLAQDGTLELPSTLFGHELLHTTFFRTRATSVPDSGATAVLLAMGLLGLGTFRRKK